MNRTTTTMRALWVLGTVAAALLSSACTTFCIAGVRESAARVCAPGEAWESCVPKVEESLDAAQAEALRIIRSAIAK